MVITKNVVFIFVVFVFAVFGGIQFFPCFCNEKKVPWSAGMTSARQKKVSDLIQKGGGKQTWEHDMTKMWGETALMCVITLECNKIDYLLEGLQPKFSPLL